MELFLSQNSKYFVEEEFRQELIKNSKIVDVERGALLINEGTYLKAVPVVLSGSIKVFRTDEGKEMLLYYINVFESCIMSISTTYNNEKANFKAIAEEDSKLLLMPATLILKWQNTYESFNLFVSDLYKKRFDDLLNAFNAVAFQKMDNRLVDYLKNKSEASGSNELKITHQKIADELGIARETASRLLKKMEQDGHVLLRRGSIKIID